MIGLICAGTWIGSSEKFRSIDDAAESPRVVEGRRFTGAQLINDLCLFSGTQVLQYLGDCK